MPGKRWSDEHKQVVREKYASMSTEQIAKLVGRDPRCVQQMARQLGVEKSPEFLAQARSAAGKKPNAGQFVKKHGLAAGGTRGPIDKTYSTWKSMWQRCTNSLHKSFGNYGARGVTVCAKWADFEAFRADMGERPDGKTLDRYPNKEGNYEPGNCRWATNTQQARNRRGSRVIEAFGRSMLLVEWAEATGIRQDTLSYRLRAGVPVEVALTSPVRGACA